MPGLEKGGFLCGLRRVAPGTLSFPEESGKLVAKDVGKPNAPAPVLLFHRLQPASVVRRLCAEFVGGQGQTSLLANVAASLRSTRHWRSRQWHPARSECDYHTSLGKACWSRFMPSSVTPLPP